MNAEQLTLLVTAILSGGIWQAAKALIERKSLSKSLDAKGNVDDANATATVIAAARELVDPLRKELAEERRSHGEEIEVERAMVAEVRAELASARAEARELRAELALARVEADNLRREREVDRARIRELEGR